MMMYDDDEMMMSEKILFIDPGLYDMGVAIFSSRRKLLYSRSIKTSSVAMDWTIRLDKMMKKLQKFLQVVSVQRVYIELPCNMGNAASSGQNILKLMALVFSIRQMCLEKGLYVGLVPVRLWKGTLPKSVTLRRMAKRYPAHILSGRKVNHNEIDAIGIGDYVCSQMKR